MSVRFRAVDLDPVGRAAAGVQHDALAAADELTGECERLALIIRHLDRREWIPGGLRATDVVMIPDPRHHDVPTCWETE